MVGYCSIDADDIITAVSFLFVCIGIFSIQAHCLLTSLAHKHPHTLTNANTRMEGEKAAWWRRGEGEMGRFG